MGNPVLVIGATGMLGEPVARRLAVDGVGVRVMSRQPNRAATRFGAGFDVVGGDVEDLSSLEHAMQGCSGVHINLAGGGDWDLERRGAVNVSAVAGRLGLDRITLISGGSTCKENSWFPMTRAKLEAEEAVRDSQVPFTILRCTMFMELLSKLVRDNKAMVMGRQPFGWHWVAADDYARMVSTVYASEDASAATSGKTLYIRGPEPLTMEEAVECFRAICAPQALLVRVPFWILSMVALFPGREELRKVGLPIMRYFAKVSEIGDPTEANALLGAPSTTLEAWCRARAAAPSA